VEDADVLSTQSDMTGRFATPIRPTQQYRRDSGRFTAGESSAVPFPIVLQQRAQEAQRTVFLRSVVRITALVIGDLLLVVTATLCIRALRTVPYLDDRIAALARAVVPEGVFPRHQVLIAAIVGLAICGSYDRSRWRTTRPLMSGVTLGLALVFWSHLWSAPTAASIAGFFVTIFAVGMLLRVGREVQAAMRKWVGPRRLGAQRALIVSDAAFARGVLAYEPLRKEQHLDIAGYVDIDPDPSSDALGGVRDLVSLIEKRKVDALLLSPRLEDDLFVDVLHAADSASIEAFVLGSAYAAHGFTPNTVLRGSVPLIQLTRPALKAHQLLLKRIFDACGALVLLILVSPLMALTALGVKATSRGPMLFTQRRVGHRGRLFQIYKFRSMVSDAEHLRESLAPRSVYSDPRLFKLNDDPRVTKFGAFMRRTSLDELPQLWNVLKGDMSLVGPRPPLPSEVELYDEQHYARFGMKPGITGPWQVSGRNNVTEFEKVMAIEAAYLSGWHIWKDMDILLRTLPVVVSMRGAR
jgi:exopolysaccharide biosynthesis polyprenyl glycosylphosphotransferase